MVMRGMMLAPGAPRPGTLVSPAHEDNIATDSSENQGGTQTIRENIWKNLAIYSLLHTLQ